MPQYSHVVALGSSFAAGPGIPPYANRAAMRSRRNYAHQLADALEATLTDLTVSGATTATLLDQPQRSLLTTFPPQVSGIPSDADVITITAGGNDLHYIATLIKAGVLGTLRRPQAVAPPAPRERLDQAVDGLARVVDAARRAAPGARILLVDYLTVLGQDTTRSPQTPFDPEIVTGLRRLGDQVSAVFAAAAERSGAELVAVSALSAGHALGSSEPWVSGLSARPLRILSSYHPNLAGMTAAAAEIQRVLLS